MGGAENGDFCQGVITTGETIRIRKIGEGRLGGAGSAMLFSVAAAI
jgi:hypothetical protein